MNLCTKLINEKSQNQLKTNIDKSFAKLFAEPNIYLRAECEENVVRLYQAIKETHPNVSASDFKVLYIASKEFFRFKGVVSRTKVRTKKARYTYEDGQPSPVSFNHHVVLEYNGKIYDLEYTDKPVTPTIHDYFKGNFYSAEGIIADPKSKLDRDVPREDLDILVIKGEDYLNQSPREAAKLSFFEKLIDDGTPQVPMLKYMESKK